MDCARVRDIIRWRLHDTRETNSTPCITSPPQLETEQMVESRNGGPGKRRSATDASAPPDSSSGIDAFLKRLDDVDLSKKTPAREAALIKVDTKDTLSTSASTSIPRQIAKVVAAILVICVIYDVAKSPTDKRLIGSHRVHDLIHDFLIWVKEHPGTGAAAFICVYALCTVLLLPGTVRYGCVLLYNSLVRTFISQYCCLSAIDIGGRVCLQS